MQKVRLKWVKNRGLDHLIARTTSIRASCLLLDLLSRLSPTSPSIPARSLARLQKPLGLTIPVLRFLRRHPTLFSESPHPRFPSLPSFSLTSASHLLNRRLALASASDSHLRLARLLLLTRSKSLPLPSLLPLRFDLGLPHNFAATFPSSHPNLFRVAGNQISLASDPSELAELAISSLQWRHEQTISSVSYHTLSKPPSSAHAPLAFPMRFPRGYGSMKKVKAWMDEFHRLPYVSPYDDASGIDPESDIYEKRNVGLLHELLALTVHKMVRRNAIRALREELGLPHKFTRLFTRYPGIFYLSLKCKTTTVVLREGYERGKLVEQHPLAKVRDKVHYVMRTGVLYRGKGLSKLVLDEEDGEGAVDGEEEFRGEGMDEDADVECFGLEISDNEGTGSDEDDEDVDDD